eukprot:CAMPEP_0202920072 /NCGR_PEP_ID=MMETSP1392-20130828/76667_1 /ASSEMBLY_ACC=CAM_ASM_000868 /TAXON_ID=225041 /ORGANISM="Chlamydomonas chlamydogama, Strain SAG 11-48b" /LENGTH=160 /DNA_ID=CAMNT_0049613553 /DNA_START=533 /DNA_END=1015 /DNA_ORIENTATION=-
MTSPLKQFILQLCALHLLPAMLVQQHGPQLMQGVHHGGVRGAPTRGTVALGNLVWMECLQHKHPSCLQHVGDVVQEHLLLTCLHVAERHDCCVYRGVHLGPPLQDVSLYTRDPVSTPSLSCQLSGLVKSSCAEVNSGHMVAQLRKVCSIPSLATCQINTF